MSQPCLTCPDGACFLFKEVERTLVRLLTEQIELRDEVILNKSGEPAKQ